MATLQEQIDAALPAFQEYYDSLVAAGIDPRRAMQQTTVKVREDIPGVNTPLEVALLKAVLKFDD